ncbi:hypothetical protein PUNSTDRAFT_81810 [Punctularia strigosozonata HHB-11173 SS5]|uniref:uncharacterized protein n=1 Tax=Punctularia strigosozonata (strain HHB-11173) TaxID=741275 RepID=UPI0004418646|nr:uncharacterized protein PUNSTDRAFT_81810 [Punctularia strigosozonata HHB-11173 SS5]EIN12540.1 hypothetical protein PUNSTDRAFT_81810 [Punctularia strigosozonata HHB-11173 SS5]
MDANEALEALSNLLTTLSENPYDLDLHAQHIRLADASGDAEQAVAAREMMTAYWPAGDEVWLPLLRAKRQSVNVETAEGIPDVLALYAVAEDDYFSVPVLQSHLEFLTETFDHFRQQTERPEPLGELFTSSWTRQAVSEVVSKGSGHLIKSHVLWDAARDWATDALENASAEEKQDWIDYLESLHKARLQQPHSNHEETFQSYSSFTTNHKPPQDYESTLVAATKLRGRATKNYERRERLENAVTSSNNSLHAYAEYITYERRARYLDLLVASGVFERAIAEAAKRRFHGEAEGEPALRAFWAQYLDTLRSSQVADASKMLEAAKRAVRSVPASGEVWARYIRLIERVSSAPSDGNGAAMQPSESVSDVYAKALSTNLVQQDVEQIIPLVLARAGYEARRIESGSADEDTPGILVQTLEDGINMVRKASPDGDPRLRLEKYLAQFYASIVDLPEAALEVWKGATKHYKNSYIAWTAYTDLLVKQHDYETARAVFSDVCLKNLDWPEAIWEAWLSMEHLHGSLEQLEACMDKVERAQSNVNFKRAKEAEKASYQALQVAMEQAASVPVAEVIHPEQYVEAPMDVDSAPSIHIAESNAKRKAEDQPDAESSKKPKLDTTPAQLKRDRENCTIFVADLPVNTAEGDLKALFKDCGGIRDIKITKLPNAVVATVEFNERESVPAALTKDKKRIHGEEIAVHLAWQSTLYITNFPEGTDDQAIRGLFSKYGTIFDVRWPSKKFKSTRRFCYVQFTSPDAAKASLELHGRELEPGMPLSVLISNPERRKERTDANADDREIYVAGLSKFATKADLEKIFKTYGTLKDVRMALDDKGNCKGFAFVEFEDEKSASAALAANNHELKSRRMAVTLADSRFRARNREEGASTGLGKRAEARSRSLRVRNLPDGTQEGLLQQALEKHARVKRVEVFEGRNEAVVELENAAEAGKLMLLVEPINFNGQELQFSEDLPPPRGAAGARGKAAKAPAGLFVPRAAASRPRAGLGHARRPAGATASAGAGAPASQPQPPKGQDDFRKMLG